MKLKSMTVTRAVQNVSAHRFTLQTARGVALADLTRESNRTLAMASPCTANANHRR